MISSALLLLLSVGADYLFADPQYKLHPVRLIGNIIGKTENGLRRIGLNRFGGGIILLLFSLFIVISCVVLLYFISVQFVEPLTFLLLLFLFYSAIGFRSLLLYSKEIAKHLRSKNFKLAKQSLSNIVGRDVELLDETEIIKATIESVAENFVDGILSPIFWFTIGSVIGNYFQLQLLFGISFVYLYRITNTLDSMVGYRNEKYELFGKASAWFDDILNFIPARLSVIIISFSAMLIGLDAKSSLRIAKKDRLNHTSPNSAHSESAVAGALNVKLGGSVYYPFGVVHKKHIGKEFKCASLTDIINASKLIGLSAIVSTIFGFLILAIV